MNLGYSFGRSPSLINGETNTADNQSVNGGLVLGSNISPRVDFTVSLNSTYSTSTNSVYPELDSDYWRHRGSLRLNWMPFGQWVFDTSVAASHYAGLGAGYDQNDVLWNAGIGYRIMKGNGGEIKLLVADILNQNNNVSRTVNELYIQDQQTNVLGRYLLLNFTYTIRNFRL